MSLYSFQVGPWCDSCEVDLDRRYSLVVDGEKTRRNHYGDIEDYVVMGASLILDTIHPTVTCKSCKRSIKFLPVEEER